MNNEADILAAARSLHDNGEDKYPIDPTAMEELPQPSKVTFLRHGETDLNQEGKVRGWTNPPP